MASQGLSRDRVLRAAVGLVDREGLEALSMRRLGQDLGVEAMSLYRHVRDKADLLDGVHGAILDEMSVPAPGRDWHRDLARLATAFRQLLLRHPRALVLFADRPAVSSASLRLVERALSLLAVAGLRPERRVRAFQSLVAYVIGHTLQQQAPGDGGRPLDYAALPAADYPQLRALGRRFHEDGADRSFAFGLEVFLRGLGA